MKTPDQNAPPTRIHVSLDVRDLRRSVEFYEAFLGEPPTRCERDYAKFEPASLPVLLALNAWAGTPPVSAETRLSHLGIQLASAAELRRARERLVEAGLSPEDEAREVCCYSEQEKLWVTDPDGNRWELFVTLRPTVEARIGPPNTCCPTHD